MENFFTEKLSELEQQQELLARRIKKLRCHIQAVKTLTDLREHPYQKSDIDTECIVSFDLIERDKLCQYIEDPYLYSRVQHTQTLPQERRGLTISAEMCSAFPESSRFLLCAQENGKIYDFYKTFVEILPDLME